MTDPIHIAITAVCVALIALVFYATIMATVEFFACF